MTHEKHRGAHKDTAGGGHDMHGPRAGGASPVKHSKKKGKGKK